MATVRAVVRDPDAKKRAILSAARRLLVLRGFQDLALDEVAREAGVAKGTLFLHFRDKEDIFEAAFADLVEGLGAELDALPRTGVEGRELLTAAAKVILGHFDRSRDFMAQFSTGRFPGCGDRSCGRLMGRMRSNVERLSRLLAAAGSPCGGRGFGPLAFFGLCRAATMRKLMEGDDRPLEREADRVVAFFLGGAEGLR